MLNPNLMMLIDIIYIQIRTEEKSPFIVIFKAAKQKYSPLLSTLFYKMLGENTGLQLVQFAFKNSFRGPH